MAYELSADLERGFVHLRYSGVVGVDERLQARMDTFDLIREQGYHRTLVETQNSNIVMSREDIVRFATSFKEIELPENYHVATVIKPGDDVDTLVEMVASIDGLNIKVFLDPEEAIDWLTAF